MSNANIYAIFDSKVAAYHVPMFLVNDDTAKRAVISAMAQSFELETHAADFQLYRLATWDDATGEIVPQNPVVVATLSDLRVHLSHVRPEEIPEEQLDMDLGESETVTPEVTTLEN